MSDTPNDVLRQAREAVAPRQQLATPPDTIAGLKDMSTAIVHRMETQGKELGINVSNYVDSAVLLQPLKQHLPESTAASWTIKKDALNAVADAYFSERHKAAQETGKITSPTAVAVLNNGLLAFAERQTTAEQEMVLLRNISRAVGVEALHHSGFANSMIGEAARQEPKEVYTLDQIATLKAEITRLNAGNVQQPAKKGVQRG